MYLGQLLYLNISRIICYSFKIFDHIKYYPLGYELASINWKYDILRENHCNVCDDFVKLYYRCRIAYLGHGCINSFCYHIIILLFVLPRFSTMNTKRITFSKCKKREFDWCYCLYDIYVTEFSGTYVMVFE